MAGDVTVMQAAVTLLQLPQHYGEVSLPELCWGTVHSTFELPCLAQIFCNVFDDVDVQHAVVVIVSPVNGDVLQQCLTVVTAQQDGAVGQILNLFVIGHCEKQQQTL